MKQQSLSGFFTSASAIKKRNLEGGSKRQSRQSLKTVDNSSFATCPLCQDCLPLHILLVHAENCNGNSASEVGAKYIGVPGPNGSNDRRENGVATIEDAPKGEAEIVAWWKSQDAQKGERCRVKIAHPIAPDLEPIPGLHLFHEFITEQEEQQILAELDGFADTLHFLPWKFARFNGSHKGKRWGVHCNLRDRRVGAAENPLPPFFYTILLPKLERIEQMMGCQPNEANAIDYRRKNGDYLTDHVDDRQLSKEPIANLSIAGDCYMTYINQKKSNQDQVRVYLPRRTLQVLTSKARYDYSHGIRNEDMITDRRVSITMRESPLHDRPSNR
jgi:alkylated DNA repair dioxygenase AlkB